jgi:hypothetical protein
MPISQRSKLLKNLSPFQVEVQNTFNIYREKLSFRGKSAKEYGRGVLGIIMMMTVYHLMNEALYATVGRRIGFDPLYYISEALKGKYGGEPRKLGADIIGNFVSNLPHGSYVATAAKGAMGLSDYDASKLFGTEDPSRYGIGGAMLEMIGEPIGQAATGKNINLLKPALTYAMPGGRQIEKTIRGLQDMAVLPDVNIQNAWNGDGEPVASRRSFPSSYSAGGNLRFAPEDTTGNLMKSALFGSFSTPEGRAYLESGAKPLSEGRTSKVEDAYRQAYAMSGVPPSMAVEAFRNLGSADTDGSGGATKEEIKAYVRKFAAEHGLTDTQRNAIFKLLTQKSEKSDEGEV